MSYTFISVVLCPYILSYLIISVLSIYMMFYHSWIHFITSILCPLHHNHTHTHPMISHTQPYTITSIVFQYSIILYSYSLILIVYQLVVLVISWILFQFINIWIINNIREYTSIYISVIIILSVSLFGIITSESLYFITFFSTYFQLSCSSLHSMEGIYLSNPSDISYTNTFILSYSGLLLAYALVIRDFYRLHHSLQLLCFLLVLTFITLQTLEFYNITLYMNESIYISVFFSLTGLHLFHILVGILLIVLIFWSSCYSRSVLNFVLFQLRVTPHHLYYTLQLVYWHFVELLWLFIYYVLYS
jgi:cytochrome c oxidase subunit 3